MLKPIKILGTGWAIACTIAASLAAWLSGLSDSYFREQEEAGDAWWW